MSGPAELTEFSGILITIRSRKSYFEVTKAIEERLQRFSVPKLMEYVTHAAREGVEAYVDEVSSPSKFSIFWEMEQGSTMRLAESLSSPSSTWSATPSSPGTCSGTAPPPASERRCASASLSATARKRAST
jgi:hypothetical protein